MLLNDAAPTKRYSEVAGALNTATVDDKYIGRAPGTPPISPSLTNTADALAAGLGPANDLSGRLPVA